MGEQITYSISEAIESDVSDLELIYVEKHIFDEICKLKGSEFLRAELFSYAARINALYMIMRAGSGHLGSSFSSLDIVSWLYLNVIKPSDRYYSSKGHDSPGLYAVHTALGILDFSKIHKLRRFGGLPGHPDIQTPGAFTNTGSLGMGVSKAKGFFIADKLKKREDGKIYVLTGDGELQEGQFWESLNTISARNDDRLVIIIDHNKVQSDKLVSKVADLGDLEAKFRAFGLDVFRCDGHDLVAFDSILNTNNGKPKVIIADTIKGKGISFMEHTSMESEFYKYHSGAPNKEEYSLAIKELLLQITGLSNQLNFQKFEVNKVEIEPLKISKTFKKLIPAYSDAITELAQTYPDIVALDADLVLDTGLIPFKDKFPERFIECGIAEQDMVSQAGTIALGGGLPIVHSFACFLTTRPLEQIYNVSTERTKVIYVGSLAGVLPGGPGHSHQAIHDITYMSSMPNMTSIEPISENQAKEALAWAVKLNSNSTYIRLVSVPIEQCNEIDNLVLPEVGIGNVLTEGSDFTILACGPILSVQLVKASEILKSKGINIKVIVTPWLNEINLKWLEEVIMDSKGLLVCENHSSKYGFSDFILSKIAETGTCKVPNIFKLGVDGIPAYGRPEEVLAYHKLDALSFAEFVLEKIKKD